LSLAVQLANVAVALGVQSLLKAKKWAASKMG
jgi:hypothetical protein